MLLILLAVPILIGVVGLVLGKGKITWQEFLVQEVGCILVVGIGYGIAIWHATSDTEIWNGVIAKKWKGTEHCCHSYPCNCRSVSCGNNCSTTVCDTCYLHPYDVYWKAVTSNSETAYSNGCNSPGTFEPGRFSVIKIGEPTAIEHNYTNYIKGNPDSILRRQGLAKKYAGKLPTYPVVHDWYRSNRVIPVGVNIDGLSEYNDYLSELNAELGDRKQVNLIFVVVADPDEMYLEALREHWLGSKKNDVVVVVGAPNFPEIEWAGVLSWTKREDFKVDVRNLILDHKKFDQGLLFDVGVQVRDKFERRPMKDFEYLKSTIEPSTGVSWFLFILGFLLAIGAEVYFWLEDPFGNGYISKRRSFR